MSGKKIFIGEHSKLTTGKEYLVVDYKHGVVNSIDDYGNRIILSEKYFVNLDEWRLIQIDKYLYQVDDSNSSEEKI
jgi:hypothetical protein